MPQKEKERLLKEIIDLRKRSNRFFYKADSYFFAMYSAVCDLERLCELSLEDIMKTASTSGSPNEHSEYDSLVSMKKQMLKIAVHLGKIKTLDEEVEAIVKKVSGQNCNAVEKNEE